MPTTIRRADSGTKHWLTNSITGIATGARGGDTACGRTIMPGVTGESIASGINCGSCRRSLRSYGWLV